jgi:anaerobic magnesium-protoporphyrin IX monomethyl ester cyclase
MLGTRTLLINPPRINGVAFTRQGRCQEREEVLGTTKPPYTLVVIAALLRERQLDVRVVDQTALDLSTEHVIDQLRREGFSPTVVIFPSTTPTLEADADEMRRIKEAFGAPLFCFGPHASTVPLQAMEKAPDVDGMFVGEPEDAVLQLVGLDSLDRLAEIPSLVFRRGDAIVAHRSHGTFTGFPEMPFPAWDLLPLNRYTLPLEGKPYLMIETSRGCPYTCDFCVAPLYHGHRFRERDPLRLVADIEHAKRTMGIEHFYLWGDTVTLNAKTFSRFCDELIARNLGIRWFGNARADNLTSLDFVQKLRHSGCWMLSMGIESASVDTRKSMVKRLEEEKIRTALANLRRTGINSFAFFIYGYPGETLASMERTTAYALDLDPDFANFYPAVPYPGTDLYEKCRREGLLVDEDWTRMEYSFYVLRDGELDAASVLAAIRRARRKFFLRPRYLARHALDVPRMLVTKHHVVGEILTRFLFGHADATPLRRRDAETMAEQPIGAPVR